ncbi:hypothetical protein T439DRAFT_123428 [Meredithblackwellia eburnea MCA 4105]
MTTEPVSGSASGQLHFHPAPATSGHANGSLSAPGSQEQLIYLIGCMAFIMDCWANDLVFWRLPRVAGGASRLPPVNPEARLPPPSKTAGMIARLYDEWKRVEIALELGVDSGQPQLNLSDQIRTFHAVFLRDRKFRLVFPPEDYWIPKKPPTGQRPFVGETLPSPAEATQFRILQGRFHSMAAKHRKHWPENNAIVSKLDKLGYICDVLGQPMGRRQSLEKVLDLSELVPFQASYRDLLYGAWITLKYEQVHFKKMLFFQRKVPFPPQNSAPLPRFNESESRVKALSRNLGRAESELARAKRGLALLVSSDPRNCDINLLTKAEEKVHEAQSYTSRCREQLRAQIGNLSPHSQQHQPLVEGYEFWPGNRTSHQTWFTTTGEKPTSFCDSGFMEFARRRGW